MLISVSQPPSQGPSLRQAAQSWFQHKDPFKVGKSYPFSGALGLYRHRAERVQVSLSVCTYESG